MYQSEQQRQLNDCRTKVAELRAALDVIANDDGFRTLCSDGAKKLQQSKAKVEKKLLPNVPYMLTNTGDCTESRALGTEGQALTSTMLDLCQKADAAQRLVVGMETTASYLLAAKKRCEGNGVSIPAYVVEVALKRQVVDYCEEEQWPCIGQMLKIHPPLAECSVASLAMFGDEEAQRANMSPRLGHACAVIMGLETARPRGLVRGDCTLGPI